MNRQFDIGNGHVITRALHMAVQEIARERVPTPRRPRPFDPNLRLDLEDWSRYDGELL